MRTIEFLPGTRIQEVARVLVANAPARTEVNGVIMRARFATSNPADVVTQYWRSLNAEAVKWSPRRTAQREAWAKEARGTPSPPSQP